MRSKFFRRTIYLLLLVPLLYFGTASATFIYRVHASNSARALVHLPTLPPPVSAKRIVVFAPHCDDETLGCGGYLLQAVKAGARVKVVMLTNGDAFRVAVERQFRSLKVKPADYVRFAGVRQEESIRAMVDLGVKREDVIFLGYPDRGLMTLWNENWSSDSPYRSRYTGADRSPYSVAFHPGAVYCGQSLLGDISAILREARPTDVFVTHPSDDHPDHSAASSFVKLALERLEAEKLDWARRCSLQYYIVHRGDWPVPQGLQREDQLVPPSEMSALDTQWVARPLTGVEVRRKEQSILDYPSQTAVMKRFLMSFARRNELFGRIDDPLVPRVKDGSIHLDGKLQDWREIRPVIQDPVNDNLLRDFQAGGDIKTVSACRDSNNLYLSVETNQAISKRVEFDLRIRYFKDEASSDESGMLRTVLRGRSARTSGSATSRASHNMLEVAIPLKELQNSHDLALNIDTSFAGLQVDRTGYRFLHLSD